MQATGRGAEVGQWASAHTHTSVLRVARVGQVLDDHGTMSRGDDAESSSAHVFNLELDVVGTAVYAVNGLLCSD